MRSRTWSGSSTTQAHWSGLSRSVLATSTVRSRPNADGARIDLEVTIENWGFVTEPYEAYYGTVSADSVAAWYAAHADGLFEQNIRKPLGNTTVNQGLAELPTDLVNG
jgi:hypothetical protein